MDCAMAHRDLYYLNLCSSKASSHERFTIMHDKMDHFKTVSLALSHKIKHTDGLMKLPIALREMLAHGHVDQHYAHYGFDNYSHDANYIVGSFAKLLRDLESPPKSIFRELFPIDPSYLLYVALLHGSEMCLNPLGLPLEVVVSAKPLTPILNVQIDNVVSNNKNIFVFSFSFLLVAKSVFCKLYVNFMLVRYTHDDIDALFG